MGERVRRVGFIGLGDIGEPMARNLCGAFDEVWVHDLRAEAVARLVASGARAAASAREVGERAEAIGVCVLDDAGTRAVVAGEEGILSGAKPGAVVALHSTIHPETARELAAQAAGRGVAVVDAQMTGGRALTEQKKLRYMVGGPPEALARVRPLLECSAAEITHCGDVGAGAIAKLCNNLVQFQAWQGYVDAVRIARAAGLSDETLLQVLGWILNDNAKVFLAARSALDADPENAPLRERFTAVMKLAEKDLHLALDVAYRLGVSVPGTALCSQQVARLFAVPDMQRR
jgi:3-hydroxyisobutyrate dehydrogenase-like beta-hydroxyacid dehydrogenase